MSVQRARHWRWLMRWRAEAKGLVTRGTGWSAHYCVLAACLIGYARFEARAWGAEWKNVFLVRMAFAAA